MPDVSWTIGTASDGSVVADGSLGETRPTLTRGDEVTLTLKFADTGASATDPQTRYQTLLEYLDYVRAVQTIVDIEGTPFYRESTADGSSLLVSVDPVANVGITGFWGVIVDGQDVASASGAVYRLELTIFVLAELGEFATRSDVKTARQL